MPLKRCEKDGESGWKWGDEGTCYTGPDAKEKATAQAVAIGDGEFPTEKSDDTGGTMSFLDKLFGRDGDDDSVEKRRHISLDRLSNMSKAELQSFLADVNLEFERVRGIAKDLTGEMERREMDVPDLDVLVGLDDEVDKSEEDTEEVEKAEEEEEDAEEVSKAKEGEEETDEVLETLKSEALPGRGDEDPTVLFVGASPSKLDVIRKKVFTGPVGKTVQEVYLSELGEGVGVYMTNAVPVYLSDDNGDPREPTAEEVEKWAPWLDHEIERTNPDFIVALGKTARDALGDRVDEFVPHPRAINIYGDSGEVSRKFARLQESIESHPDPEPQELEKTYEADIVKSDDERRVVYGIALEPNVEDSDGNWSTPEEIEKAAHFFMQNFRQIGSEHVEKIDEAYPVESWVSHEDTEIGGQAVSKGTWVVGVKIENDEHWEMVKSGEYTGFSIGARAIIDQTKRLED